MKYIKYVILFILLSICVCVVYGQTDKKSNIKQSVKEESYCDSVKNQLRLNSLILNKMDSLQKKLEIKNKVGFK